MSDKNTVPESNDAPPAVPPKLFDQLAAMQSGGAQPSEAPKRKSRLGILLWVLIAASAGILAFVFLGKPAKQADVTTEAVAAATALPLKPHVSIPVPTDAEVDAAPVPPAGNDVLAQLDKSLTAEINRGEGGMKPLIAKASLSVLDPKRGLTEDDLSGQNPDAKTLAAAYQAMFKRMGENLGKDDQILSDIDYLSAEQDRFAESLDSRRGLAITKVVLCQRVSGYGRYEEFHGNGFQKNSLALRL